ncbi:hypothetical protein F2Q68_00032990 [Brassica cretica]|uniref:SHSP domain-containing protein n=1 Tax=Brassica cretica TaxID=69181 RepID=A0A8S9GL05_BRACR|nr:hypothetical protein F2Q68_00032990 [Brassica cretica]
MLRRQRPGGGRHPPPLTPTVSNFKPRAQWNNSGSSIILYVNLPGFYRDQVEIKKDEKTRAIYIQGQRPLSTHTKARFNEVYRVPESCDMTKLNTSFSHGLLTIEFPAVVEGEKTEKAGNDQGKTVERLDNEDNRGAGLSGSSLERKKPSDKEKQVGTSQEKAVTMANKEEPITSKSVVEGKRAVPAAKVKNEEKVKEGEASSAQIGQQKTQQKVKEEEARSTPIIGDSLEAKVLAKEEKEIERKKEADIGQKKTGEKVKGEGSTRMPNIGGSLEPKVHSKAEKIFERKGDGEIGQKLKEKVNVISKHDEKKVGYKVSEGEIQERVEEKKVEEAGIVKNTRDLKGKPEVMEPRRVDSDVNEDLTKGGEDKEESEKGTLLVEEQRKTNMDTTATEGRGHEEERSQIYDTSLVNVGVASLVIMGFGFYRDQVEIKKDEKTRAIYIQGQRPLSTHTKARFNEVYRVPESCDMTKLNTSFSHGLLTIEFPAVVEGEKTEKAGNDQGKTVQGANNEENSGTGLGGSSLGRKKPSDKEKQVGTSQEKAVTMANKEEPITYKRAVPAAKVKNEEKVKEGEASSAQIGQQKTLQKVKEEEARSTPIIGGSLEAKVLAKEEKEIERKKEADIGQKKTGEKVKEEGTTRIPTIGGSLEPKVHSKAEKIVERKGDGEIGQKLKERVNVISKHDEKMVGYKVSEGEIQERVEEKKVEEAGLVKETRDLKGKPEVMEPRRVDSDVNEDLTGGEDKEESEKGTLLVEEQRKTNMDTTATEGRGLEEERSQIYDTSLVNVVVASLVIMGFGAYVFLPLVKMFY